MENSPNRNTFPAGFLKKYGKSEAKKNTFLPLKNGFLKLSYEDGDISRVYYVKKEGCRAIGAGLEFAGANEEATYISPMGVSGLQWSGGKVIWGTTYDFDDEGPKPIKTISLDDWVDEMIQAMINQEE